MSQIGEKIRARRQALGWTLDRLAREAKVSKGFLSDLETGKRKGAGADYLSGVAAALGVSVDHLITGTAVPDPADDIQIPSRLAELARAENLSFQQALILLRMRQQAHFRNQRGSDDFDWRAFYEAVKAFI
jgi:transcriptional regulator with XRE-family HTH domain